VVVGFGPNYQQFGGGPADPSHPNSKLNTPNGIAQLSFGTLGDVAGLSLEIKSIAVTRINANPIIARIDANSSVTFRPGTGFTYGTTQPPINVNGKVYSPPATNQISRFDQNGMTNLIFNERTPDDPSEVDRFLVRGAPEPLAAGGTTFVDATNAVVNIRARLTQALTNAGVAQSLTIYARDRQGNDNAAGKGADEWDYHLDLHQFNTSTMTTVSIPLSAFTRNMAASALGPPLGFGNFGSGTLTNFGLYEFGGAVPAGGLLKLEMEYMEIRLPSAVPEPSTLLLAAMALAFVLGLRRRRL
jgi:PEP-CTERM motif-containing protein